MRRLLIVGLIPLAVVVATVLGAEGDGIDGSELLPGVEEILERYVQAVGGRDAIEKLTTRVCTGHLIHDMPSRQPPVYEVISIQAYTKVPDRVLVIQGKSDGVRREGFDGKAGWWEENGRVERDDDAVRSKLAWLLNPQGPLRVQEYFPGLAVKGKETIEGRPAYVLEPAELRKAHYALHFDLETGMLVRIGYYWDIEDYREVNGVKFPFRVVMSRKGGSSTYVFDEVNHNVPIEDARFAMPELEQR